jgi:hypothetical protein
MGQGLPHFIHRIGQRPSAGDATGELLPVHASLTTAVA